MGPVQKPSAVTTQQNTRTLTTPLAETEADYICRDYYTELQINISGRVTTLGTPSNPDPATRLANYQRENQILC